ncbi:putative protease [Candidatus Photodesmus katoptron]|uniref:Peptidase U32 n=1 Tax=Candidatus Photodesmus katoptron Akat1 TaxID=1236703 RepID=S3DLG7_9GAMM|nr:U32 family peptidase [Candidatus Photodesmus katoptron]EPE38009.1 peptidase U32 [Candidatus Photodesmus katoptron Akat1]KEY90749.1 putative protease [Candidatus Photodesmus katoptron]
MSKKKAFIPELLSPAGSLKNMRYAFAYGADAVYAGQPRYSLRVRNNTFNLENLEIGIYEAHALKKKLYVVCNIQSHNAKIKTFIRDIEPIIRMNPDALIMSDPGLIMITLEQFPEIPIHLSVQANAVNWATVKFWGKHGIKRVILSRELSLEEIDEIYRFCQGIELEVFVHGALCIAYSGRCLLSSYINKRDANQGTCTNACRWLYNIQEEQEDISEKTALLSESHRPEEKMIMLEDQHGTYILNSKDLRAVQHVDRLIKIGIHALKIEGRSKSFYYCARTTQVYRKAIDDSIAGRPFDQNLTYTLENLSNRGYTEGFLRRHAHQSYQQYDHGQSISNIQQFVGEFTGKYHGELAEVEVKNRFMIGDTLELITPKSNITFTLKTMQNQKFKTIKDAKGNGYFVFISIPNNTQIEYALLARKFK